MKLDNEGSPMKTVVDDGFSDLEGTVESRDSSSVAVPFVSFGKLSDKISKAFVLVFQENGHVCGRGGANIPSNFSHQVKKL